MCDVFDDVEDGGVMIFVDVYDGGEGVLEGWGGEGYGWL